MTNFYQLDTDIWINEIRHEDYVVRNVLITDHTHAIIWDTQSHPDDIACFTPHLKDKKVTILYSHADWDHIWGTSGLPHETAEIIGHDFCLKRFSQDAPVTLSEKQKVESDKFKNVHLHPPTRTFSKKLMLCFEQLTLELHHLPGHTPDSIVGFIPEKGILLMGDTIETPFPFVPPGCKPRRWIEELHNWKDNPYVKSVIPSHGPIGGVEQIDNTIDYLEDLIDGIEAKLPDDVTDFYSDTHHENLRNVKHTLTE